MAGAEWPGAWVPWNAAVCQCHLAPEGQVCVDTDFVTLPAPSQAVQGL